MFALRGSAVALAAAALLGACTSSMPPGEKAPVESRTPAKSSDANAGNGGAQSESQVKTVDMNPSTSAADAMPRIVYFDFDSYTVKDEYRPVIETQAKRLAADRNKHMVVEGHTDERGGSEYNLALGQKRAQAVVKSLETLGAGESQLEAVSFGKERPAVQGSTEDAWAKNRRAELKDR